MPQGPRIVYVGTLHPHRGGSAIVANDLLPALAARGFPTVAVAPFYREPPLPLNSDLAESGVEVVRFPMPTPEINPHAVPDRAYRSAQRRHVWRILANVVRGNGRDVLLIGRESFVAGMPDLAKTRGMRVITVLHGVAVSILRGHIAAAAFPNMIDELSRCDLVISVAEHMAAALGEVGVANVRTVANGIDVATFRPGPARAETRRHLGVPQGALAVGHVSNLKPVKRVEDFIAAAAIALEHRPDLHFVILGDGPGRASLEADCARRGLADRVRFLGWIEREAIADYYRALDIMVLASSTEAMPLACLEAMASGCLMIASDIPASRELLVDGMTGLLFRTGDVPELARLILLAAGRPDFRRQIAGKARQHVARHYTLRRMVEGYRRILEELANAAPRPPVDA